MDDSRNKSAPAKNGQERSEIVPQCGNTEASTSKREINLDRRRIAQIAVAAIDGMLANR